MIAMATQRGARSSGALALVPVLALVLAASPAWAGDEAAPKSPQAQFEEAQTLFDHGDHAAALDLFREVYSATKSPNALLMAGHCLLKLGRSVEAYEELSRAATEAGKR